MGSAMSPVTFSVTLFHSLTGLTILSAGQMDDAIREILGVPADPNKYLHNWSEELEFWIAREGHIGHVTHLMAPTKSPLYTTLKAVNSYCLIERGTTVPIHPHTHANTIDAALRKHMELRPQRYQVETNRCLRKWNLRFGKVLLEGSDDNIHLGFYDKDIIDFLRRNLILRSGFFILRREA